MSTNESGPGAGTPGTADRLSAESGQKDMHTIPTHTDELLERRFNAIVETWDESLRCGTQLPGETQCSRLASWLVDYHGCTREPICAEHLAAWRQRWRAEPSTCTWCGTTFNNLDDSYQAVAL